MTAAARRQMRIIAGLFAIAAIAIGILLYFCRPLVGLAFDGRRTGHIYSIPSQSMVPTLVPGDRILPRGLAPGEPSRGQVIVYRRTPNDVRVVRVAAIGGDVIAMKGDVPWINGAAALRRDLGAGPPVEGGQMSRLYEERLPGETGTHRVIDTMTPFLGDYPDTAIPQGKLFVLGDNRDRAADSRVPPDQLGAGLVSVDQVLGVVDYVAWSSTKGRMAKPIDQAMPAKR